MSKKDEKLLLDRVIINERAKNIVGAPWGSVVENLEWLIKAQLAKIADKMDWQHGKDFVTLTELMALVSNLRKELKGGA